jgi:Bax protein
MTKNTAIFAPYFRHLVTFWVLSQRFFGILRVYLKTRGSIVIKKTICFFTMILFCCNIACAQSLTSTQQKFVNKILSASTIVNTQLHRTRAKLLQLYDHSLHHEKISKEDQEWLAKVSDQYKVDLQDLGKKDAWQDLLLRVDEIPPSLILAQAIHESGWGKSRVAKQENNYFGKRSFKTVASSGKKHHANSNKPKYKKYPTVLASVGDYVHNLNTHEAYKDLRKMRKKERQQHEAPSGRLLAKGLEKYSTQGKHYVKLVDDVIIHYDLEHYNYLAYKF